MSQPYGPPPGPQQPQPHPGSGPFPQQGPPSGPLPQPYPHAGQQPYPTSGPVPQPYPASGLQPSPAGPQQGYPQQPYQPGYQQPPYGYPQQPYGQGGPPFPGRPPQPGPMLPPPPPGTGRVLLDASYNKLAMTMALFKPGITINGAPGPQARWGKNAIDLPPGQYQIEVHVKYLWRFGSATAVLPVQAGQQLEAYYRPPMVAFGKGALGPTPQSTPNIAVTIVIVVLALVVGAFLGVLPTLLLS